MTNIEKYNLPEISSIREFQRAMNKQPLKKHVKQSPSSDKVRYLPIGVIEAQLDETYFGLWQTSAKVELMGNSLVATVQLRVFHPTARVWITRTGVGAKKVQLNKGAQTMDTAQMKADAFEKGVGAAKSMALRNAAHSLGDSFGRSLNRDMDDFEFEYLDEQQEAVTERTLEAMGLLQSSTLPDATKTMVQGKIDRASSKELSEIINFLNSKQS